MRELSDQQPSTLTNYSWLEAHHLIKTHQRFSLLHQLDFDPNAKILDAACGPGFWTEMMASAVGEHGRVIGIDSDAELINEAIARKNAGLLRDRIEFLEVDLQRYEASRQFTDVVCFNCLPYFEQPKLVLEHLRRFVGPGGRIHLKETDMSWSYFSGIDSELYQRVVTAAKKSSKPVDPELQYDGFFGAKLHSLMARLEPEKIDVSVSNVRFSAPYSAKQIDYIQLSLDSLRSYAEPFLESADLQKWRDLSDISRLSSLEVDEVFGMSEIICTGTLR